MFLMSLMSQLILMFLMFLMSQLSLRFQMILPALVHQLG
jgi:ascorbate-specific PTS system EIIC-type component UlaA